MDFFSRRQYKHTDELICQIETDPQIFKNLWLPKGTGRSGRGGLGGWHMHTEVYGMIGQQGPAV